MIIYKATNTINGKCYIGKTIYSLENRMADHKSNSKSKRGYFYSAVKKYGWDAFKWDIIDNTCETEDELNMMEYHYIMQYNAFGDGGYNLTYGGDGVSGHKHSDETKLKIGDASRGRVISEEQKISIGNASRNKIVSDETKKLISVSNKGRIRSDKTKLKISISAKGRVLSDETKLKMSIAHKKR